MSPELLAAHNRAVGLMGHFDYPEAVKLFVRVTAERPDLLDVQVNLAIARLNLDSGGTNAYPLLDQVLKADPNHLRARYCKAILLHHDGDLDAALPHFQFVAEKDPTDVFALDFCGHILVEKGKVEQGLPMLERAHRLDPNFVTPVAHLQGAMRKMGNIEKLKEYTDHLSRLQSLQRSHGFIEKYTKMGPKAECVALSGFITPPGEADGPLFAAPTAIVADDRLPDDAEWAAFDADHRGTITACDIDGNRRMDLFISGTLKGGLSNVVVLQDDAGALNLAADHPLAKVDQINAVLWGDYDNDGLTDVYFCRRGPNQLWRQSPAGQWQDVTAETECSGGEYNTVDGVLFDADHDADLDLLLVNADGPCDLLSNEGTGKFVSIGQTAGLGADGRPSRGAAAADLDGDRDLDILILKAAPPHEAWANDLAGRYHPAEGLEALLKKEIHGILASDQDADRQVDLFTTGPGGALRWTKGDDGTWNSVPAFGSGPSIGSIEWLAIADVQGDGPADFLIGSSTKCAAAGLSQTNEPSAELPACDGKVAGWAMVTLDGTRGPSVAALRSGQSPVLWRPGSGRHLYAGISLVGKQVENNPVRRSNASGIGTDVAVRVGSLWRMTNTLKSQSGAGQSLEPVAAGLGPMTTIDFVEMQWTDGVFQAEVGLEAAVTHIIEEAHRLPTSCPLLFTWDGTRYAFVTDLLGKGGLGYFMAPGEYAPPAPEESLLIPAALCAPRDGRYEFKIMEGVEELTYLDHASLSAFDLPPGWDLVVDERQGLAGPMPTGRPIAFRHELTLSRAMNDRGEDVSRQVLHADLDPAMPGTLDARFIGRTAPYWLHLEFAEPLDAGPGRPYLSADGWIEYPYSQTMFAAWQAGAAFEAPTIEARTAGGEWQVVLRQFGFPAGMPRSMVVPLDGLPPGARELRISSNLQLYWDRLSVVFEETCPEMIRHDLKLERAQLADAGFPRRHVGPAGNPWFDYDDRRPVEDTRHPPGFYTRFGPVEELVLSTDDALAILGPGEEVHLWFAAPDREPPTGWTRRLVLSTTGWCKDTDLYTQHGSTVEPVPARNAEPTAARRELHPRYQTRFEAGR
jgi:hypothetical protein